MPFNLKKQALQPLGDILLPDPGSPDLDFGVNQAMVDIQWETVGKYRYPNKQDMVDAYGGTDVMREKMQGIKELPNANRELINTVENINSLGSKKVFNLKKAQRVDPALSQGVDPTLFNGYPMEQMEMENEQADELSTLQPPFSKIEDFRHWADVTPQADVLQALTVPAGDDLKEAMEQYLVSKDEGEKGKIAADMFSDINFPLREEQVFMAQQTHFGSVNEIIKKLAQNTVNRNKKKAFNLTKTAQHKTLDNAIMWGPGQTRIDPFLHQPVSDWHIVERNKGFGLVVDDIWNIDYETIWRENIMDKYSRPYKNKEGEWVGGYLNKRFETDRNIPEANNLQLKPGQLRKPILPEYGNTESRLQAARAKGDIAGAIDTSKPYNWKESSKKKS